MAEAAPPRHKRRTPPHKKHSAYPGIRLKTDVKVESGSIRPLNPKKFVPQPAEKPAPVKMALTEELEAFYNAGRGIADDAKKSHNRPLAQRNAVEWMYGYTYTKAMHKGQVNNLKRKYRGLIAG